MRNTLVVIIFLTGFTACGTGEGPDTYPPCNDSYIQSFVEVDGIEVYNMAGLILDEKRQSLNLESFAVTEPGAFYNAGSLALLVKGIASQGEFTEVFENKAPQGQKIYEKYIQQIGDTGFKSKVRFGLWESAPKAITTPLQSIRITCDKDLNEDFPAGSELSSVFSVFFEYPGWVVANGYKDYKEGYKRTDIAYPNFPCALLGGNLSTMSFEDKQFIGPVWICKLNISPQRMDKYVFTVKVTMVDGSFLVKQTVPFGLLPADKHPSRAIKGGNG